MMNAAAGIFLAARRKPKLPYDAEVEYLESTGTQWIDTGVLAASSTDISIQFAVTSNVTQGIFGRRVSALNNSMLVLQYLETNTKVRYLRWDRGSGAANMAEPVAGHVYSGASDGRYFTLDGTAYHVGNLNGSGPSLYLFAVNQGGSPILLASALRIYGCRITDGGVLVRDMTPVRFTNELGQSEGAMYDRANPTVGMDPDGSARTDGLYRNRGTGAFTIGPDKVA